VLEQFVRQLASAQPLTDEQALAAVELLVDEAVPALAKADFLSQLARKGETISEIAVFARALRAKSIQVPLDSVTRIGEILDVVGTGGDRLSTFNISTTVAIICAAAGVTVAKHGNRASTSLIGSADVMEALGVRIDLTPEEAACSLREHGFAFFYAPKFHPAFRHIMPARKLCAERGQSTIFNFLGPCSTRPAPPPCSSACRGLTCASRWPVFFSRLARAAP
jgi:anthranilate phosphoribosyltransferase